MFATKNNNLRSYRNITCLKKNIRSIILVKKNGDDDYY